MPVAALHPCAQPRCPALAPAGKARCAGHDTDRQRGSSTAQGYGAVHRKWRMVILSRDPYCAQCGAPATVADHIIPLNKGGDWAFENGQGMCDHCHNSKRATEDKR
jgi:5-methylcytosine-specific restriction endonuclease McrA